MLTNKPQPVPVPWFYQSQFGFLAELKIGWKQRSIVVFMKNADSFIKIFMKNKNSNPIKTGESPSNNKFHKCSSRKCLGACLELIGTYL